MKVKRIVSLISALALSLTSVTVSASAVDENTLEETVIFSGESTIAKSWTLGPQVQTANGSGDFDPSDVTPGGYFTIDYTGTEGKVYLALAEWTTNAWISIDEPTSTTVTETGYQSIFSYDDCMKAYQAKLPGSTDMSDADAICAGTTNSTDTTTITKISWHGYPTSVDLGEKATVLFKGCPSAQEKSANLKFFFTKHVGGEWDASQINEGSYFYTEYLGAKDGVSLALQSSSGTTRWAELTPDETGKLADGRWYSIYKYETFSKKFGTNFARLDQIQARTLTSEKVTLKRIAYFAGEGAPVDTSDGTWDRPDSGIAFIGDSIVENPHVDTAHLKAIDWNGILGRTDCVNYGIGGQTTQECVARIDEIAKKNYDKVVMLCGINDIGRGLTNEQIVANYKTMYSALKEKNPDIEIFIMSVLPTTPVFYTDAQGRIRELNSELKKFADSTEDVTFVNIHSEFYDESTGYCKTGLTFDGLHPNLTGYSLIANVLNPYLNGLNMTIYYQTRYDNSEIRFVAEVNKEAAQAAVEAIEETLIAKSDNINVFDSAYGQKIIKKAYKSLIANGKTITAPEGKCYLISTPVSGIEEGDKVKGLFTLDGTSTFREVSFGSSKPADGVLWEGSADTGSWENNIDLGITNIPNAEEGGVLTIEYISTSSRGRSKLQVVTSTSPWTTLSVSGADTFSTSGGKLDIVLTADAAKQLVNATSILVGGQAAIITRVSYTAPGDVVKPELPELDPLPEGAVELWTGAGDVGVWGTAVKLNGFENIPTAKAGDKLVVEYLATGAETQLSLAGQLGEEWTWTQMNSAEGNSWFDTAGGKLEIVLNAEQAELLKNSKQMHAGGKNAIIMRFSYIPSTGDTNPDDSSSKPDDSSKPEVPEGAVVVWEGSATVSKWGTVDIGLTNIPYAQAGGVFTFEYTTEADAQFNLSVNNKAVGGYLQAKANKTTISFTLTEETANILVNATSVKLKGNKGTVTRIIYTPPKV